MSEDEFWFLTDVSMTVLWSEQEANWSHKVFGVIGVNTNTVHPSQKLSDLSGYLQYRCPRNSRFSSLRQVQGVICLTKFRNLSEHKQTCDITSTDSITYYRRTEIPCWLRHLKTGKTKPTYTFSLSGVEGDFENLLIQKLKQAPRRICGRFPIPGKVQTQEGQCWNPGYWEF